MKKVKLKSIVINMAILALFILFFLALCSVFGKLIGLITAILTIAVLFVLISHGIHTTVVDYLEDCNDKANDHENDC